MNLGSYGKIKVAAYLIEKGYDVFIELDGKSPFDLVAHKDGILERVEVKTTKTRSKSNSGWEVQIKSIRPNRTKNRIVGFDNTKSDILCVYIQPIDKILLYKSCNIKNSIKFIIHDDLTN